MRTRANHLPSCLGVAVLALVLVNGATPAETPTSDDVRHLIDDGRYAAAEVLARQQLAESEARYGPGSIEAAEALDVLVEALVWEGKFTRDETLELARRAVRIKEEAPGQRDSSLAWSLNKLARVEFERVVCQPRAEEAIGIAHRALEMQERVLGPYHLDVAATLENLGLMRMYQDPDIVRAVPFLERSLAIRERALGGEHRLVARSLGNLGMALLFHDAARAKEVVERALAIYDRTLRLDHPERAFYLGLSGAVSFVGDRATADRDKAKDLLLEALRIEEENFGREHYHVGMCLQQLGYWEVIWGDITVAWRRYREALSVFEKTLGPNHIWTIDTRTVLLFHVPVNEGDYTSAERGYEMVAPLYEGLLDHRSMIMVHFMHAYLLDRTGRYAEAKPIYERVIAWAEAEYGRNLRFNDRRLTQPYQNYAALLARTGDFARARSLFERALEIQATIVGPEHPDLAMILRYMGTSLLEAGDYAGAQQAYERALEIVERAMGDENLDVSLTLIGLANVFLEIGDHRQAQAVLERAQRICKTVHGCDSPLAVIHSNLGRCSLQAGDYANARQHLERALEIDEKASGPESAAVARRLELLGIVHHQTGDHEGACRLFERSVEAREKIYGPSSPYLATTLGRLARAQLAMEDSLAALATSLQAEKIGREHLRRFARSSAETMALRYARIRPGGLDVALALAPELGVEERRRVWDAQIRARAVVQDEMAARHRGSLGAGDTAIDSLWATVQASRTRLANLAVRGAAGMEMERYRELLDGAMREKEEAENALAARSARFAAELASNAMGLEDVVAALPEDAALVSYCRYETPWDADDAPASRIPPNYVAFIARKSTGDVEAVNLGEARAIEDLVATWRREAARPAEGVQAKEAERASRHAGEALRRRVWDPVAERLEGVERVLVVPDGALHLVNLGALPLDDQGFLVEHCLIHYLSAERDLIRDDDVQAGHDLLAVGDPDYERAAATDPEILATLSPYRGKRRPLCEEFARVKFDRLPGTGREVRDVERTWRQAQPGEEVVVLTGARAEESRVKAEVRGKRVVHLATHGFFFDERCAPAMGGSRGIGVMYPLEALETPAAAAEVSPLLLTGLALAGANRRQEAGPESEDGVLTAEELATLDLRGVEWAVLSACDTGVGQLRAGEGVLGLGRAVRVSGARTLILSLWPVEDEAAREWMRALYEARFAHGLSTAEAVREASLTVLRARRAAGASTHPSTWAAFIATGDWR